MLGNSIFDDDNQRTAFKLKADRPKSAFAQPVIHHPSHHRADDSFVGMVVGEIDWGRLFFADIMPFGSSGIYMVLRNSCGKAFTYFVNEENGEVGEFGHKEKVPFIQDSHSLLFLNHPPACIHGTRRLA